MENRDKAQGPTQEWIGLNQVSTHNLKSIDIEFPLYKLSVVTGVSGSGKSSLVFDTLYAEAYRRYLDSLSSFARQYIQAMPRPVVGQVTNLPPAIAVRQSTKGANKRSTVGSLSELNDLLQTLFAGLSEAHCLKCGERIHAHTSSKIANELQCEGPSRTWTLTCQLSVWENLSPKQLYDFLLAQGFSRIWDGSTVVRLESFGQEKIHDAELVIDRVKNTEEAISRLNEALKLAYRLGKGRVRIWSSSELFNEYRQNPECQTCGISLPTPKPALFSFSHPLGACDHCQGYGDESAIDWSRVFPDHQACIRDEGIAPFNFGQHRAYYQQIKASVKLLAKPFGQYSESEWSWLKYGDGKDFAGVAGYFAWLDTKKYKPHYRMHRAKFTIYVTCTMCLGSRYSQASLAYRLGGLTIAATNELSIKALSHFFEEIKGHSEKAAPKQGHDDSKREAFSEAFGEAQARCRYLKKIGLGYLSLCRSATSLSGGELQRIHMARCLGSALTETLFCLDEPTAGLHAHDSENLLNLLYELRDQGNTVVVVEHEKLVIDGADARFEIGPAAGHLGGELVDSKLADSSIFDLPASKAKKSKHVLKLFGADIHNLKGETLEIPLARLSVVCGLSGSGKTSLIQHALFPILSEYFSSKTEKKKSPAQSKRVKLDFDDNSNLTSVHLVSQAPLGKSSRSNIVTYLDILSPIRQIMASQSSAKSLGLGPGHFSFNVAAGRCENCKGMGLVLEDLSFLGEIEVVCPVCDGKRFQDKVLSIRYRSLNILEILDLKVSQAREFFWDHEKICKPLDDVIHMGLGYVALGQHTRSFSGGEAQRLKLLNIHKGTKKGQSALLIFDEPSTGLADSDVAGLLKYFRSLTDQGHTVLVIEHNLDMIRSADYVVELGPGAADAGGHIVFQGGVESLKACQQSLTRRYL